MFMHIWTRQELIITYHNLSVDRRIDITVLKAYSMLGFVKRIHPRVTFTSMVTDAQRLDYFVFSTYEILVYLYLATIIIILALRCKVNEIALK